MRISVPTLPFFHAIEPAEIVREGRVVGDLEGCAADGELARELEDELVGVNAGVREANGGSARDRAGARARDDARDVHVARVQDDEARGRGDVDLEDRVAAEARLKEYGAKLQAAYTEAATIVEDARREAERLREDIRQRAKSDAEKLVAGAERQIQLQTSQALEQIRREAVDLSVMIASKIIQRNLTKEDNERLIDEALKQVEGRRN